MKKAIAIILSIVLVMAIIIPVSAISTVAVKGIKLNKSKITLKVGQTSNLKVTLTPANTTQKLLTYVTLNQKVATVDKTGKITGVSAGTATIVVYTSNKTISAKCSVTVEGPYAKHLNISYFGMTYPGYMWEADTPTQKYIEQKFNVSFKIVKIDTGSGDQMRLYWATGDIADCPYVTGAAGDGAPLLKKLADDGILRSFSEDVLRKNMPNWMKKVETNVDPAVVKSQMLYKGKIYGIPFDNYSNAQTHIMLIRKDWMNKVGITKQPETVNELHDVLKKIIDNARGNGIKDFYGIGPCFGHGFNYIAGAFGIQPNSYYIKNGKVIYTSLTDQYKEFLKLLNQWYKEGLIDPEFVTDDRNKERNKWSEGKSVMLVDHPWWCVNSTPDNVVKILTDKDPNAQVAFLSAIKGLNGESGGMIGYPNIYIQGAAAFSKNCSDEKMIRIMAIKEALATDQNFFVRVEFGEEGKQYTKDKEGVIIPTPEYTKTENLAKAGISEFFGLMPQTMVDLKLYTPESDMSPYEISMKNNKSYVGVAFPFSGTNESDKTYGTDLNTMGAKFYFDAITGKVNIDTGFAAFKKQFLTKGGQKVIDEYQKLYDKSK